MRRVLQCKGQCIETRRGKCREMRWECAQNAPALGTTFHSLAWEGAGEIFLLFFHQYLDVEQLFPICFGAFFAGNAPEVFPDFVVEGIDFGGLGVGDGAIGGAVHFVLLSAYMLFQTQMFYQSLSKTILLCSICQGVVCVF